MSIVRHADDLSGQPKVTKLNLGKPNLQVRLEMHCWVRRDKLNGQVLLRLQNLEPNLILLSISIKKF